MTVRGLAVLLALMLLGAPGAPEAATGGTSAASRATARAPGAPVPLFTGIDAGGGPWAVRFDVPPCLQIRNPYDSRCGRGFLAYFDFAVGGIFTAAGDVDGDGHADVVTAPAFPVRAEIRSFTGAGTELGPSLTTNTGNNGARVAVGDIDADGRAEILAADDRGCPNVSVFDALSGNRVRFFGETLGCPHAVRIAAGDVDGDGRAEIVTARGPGADPRISIYSATSAQFVPSPLRTFLAFSAGDTAGLEVAAADVTGDGNADVVAGTTTGLGTQIRVFDGETSRVVTSFFAFEEPAAASLRLAAADLDRDGRAEIVAAANTSRGPRIAVFSGLGTRLREIAGSTLDESVAVGDVDADGTAELVVGSGPGMDALVRELGPDGRHERTFAAYDATFQNGVRTAAGDLRGDGEIELVTGQGPGGHSEVDVFDDTGSRLLKLFPFGRDSVVGVFVATGDVDGDRDADIVVGADEGAQPLVRAYDHGGRLLFTILARESSYRGGVRVATADLDGDGTAEIVTGSGPEGPPLIRVFGPGGQVRASFDAFSPFNTGGVWVASGDLDGDGLPEMIAATGAGSEPLVRVFTPYGRPQAAFSPYEPSFTGDVHVTAGDVDGDGHVEIVTAPGRIHPADIRLFDGVGNLRASFLAHTEFGGGIFVAAPGPIGPRLELGTVVEPTTMEGRIAGVQATIFDPDGTLLETDFAATVEWSDGVKTRARVVGLGPGRYTAVGERRLTRGGDFSARIIVTDRRLRSATATASVTVLRRPFHVRGVTARARGTRFDGVVARVEDGNAYSSARDFKARVSWGDGRSSRARLVKIGAGRFAIHAAHAYRRAGNYVAVVRVDDVDGTARRAESVIVAT